MSLLNHRRFDRNLARHLLGLSASLIPEMPASLRRQAILIAISAGGLVSQAHAAPISTDLGILSINEQANYQTPSTSFEVTLTDNEVQWFSFTLTEAITAANGLYLDIDTYPNTNHHVDTTIGVYNSQGNRVAVNADAGDVFYAQLSFGDTDPARGPLTYTVGSETFLANPAAGINGNLTAGTYYLAVTRFEATFGETDFAVSSDSNGTDTFLLQFRGPSIAAVPEPATIALLGLGSALILYRVSNCRRAQQ